MRDGDRLQLSIRRRELRALGNRLSARTRAAAPVLRLATLAPSRLLTGPAPRAFDSPIPCHSLASRVSCAGWGNRTPDHSLENCRFAIKLIPQCAVVYRISDLFSSARAPNDICVLDCHSPSFCFVRPQQPALFSMHLMKPPRQHPQKVTFLLFLLPHFPKKIPLRPALHACLRLRQHLFPQRAQ